MSINGQDQSLTFAKGHSDLKKIAALFFQKCLGSFETKVHIKAYGRTEMKIYTSELDHMTEMAAMPIYGKIFL